MTKLHRKNPECSRGRGFTPAECSKLWAVKYPLPRPLTAAMRTPSSDWQSDAFLCEFVCVCVCVCLCFTHGLGEFRDFFVVAGLSQTLEASDPHDWANCLSRSIATVFDAWAVVECEPSDQHSPNLQPTFPDSQLGQIRMIFSQPI